MTTNIDRDRAIARVVFLLPALTDEGLSRLLREAEQLALTHPRELTNATLAAEQREREGLCAGAPGCSVCDDAAVLLAIPVTVDPETAGERGRPLRGEMGATLRGMLKSDDPHERAAADFELTRRAIEVSK